MARRDGNAAPLISVCIVTGMRPALLDACLASLQAQEAPPPFEVLVCADRDPEVVEVVRGRFPDARICLSEGRLPGGARNLLVEQAGGDILLFLDDDVSVRPDLLSRLRDLARRHPTCTVFGGPNLTPAASSRFQVVQGEVLGSVVGSGPVRRRYRSLPPGPADERWLTLCNLAVRREEMVPFDDGLRCAEENGVLAELGRRRATMRYDPGLVAFHERRATARTFGAQIFKYGHGRGQLTARDARTLRAAYLAPAAFVLYLMVSIAMVAAVGAAALLPAAGYAVAVSAASTGIAVRLRRAGALPLAAAIIVELHACYAAGVVTGFARERAVRGAGAAEAPLSSDDVRVPAVSWV